MNTYRMPAEWEPHRATWLAWPKNKITWPGKVLKEIEEIYLQMISALLTGEKVYLLVDSKDTVRNILTRLTLRKIKARNLDFIGVKTVDTWIRDYGPMFVVRCHSEQVRCRSKLLPNVISRSEGPRDLITRLDEISRFARNDSAEIAFVKWRFNAWGGKYGDFARDNRVVDKIISLKSYHRFDPGIVMEGGSVDVNGRGTLLTTEQCLLNSNRNKKLLRAEIEGYLKKYLGVRNIVWLKEGIEGDDTDGHVDDLSRFVNPTTIVTATETDPRDKNHAVLEENLEILKAARSEKGKKFTIVELPMPGRVRRGRGDMAQARLPASYANFYIANKVVLVPVYSHKNDKQALKILRRVFPGRRVIGIECTPLVYGLGSIHCVTQQQPK